MKKITWVALLMALILAVSCVALAEDASLTKITDKGTFVLGFDCEFPPMGFIDEATGAYTGFDLDVAAEVCKRLGVELVPQPIDWAAKDMELSNGSIDCIWNGMTATQERAESMALSIPYLENDQVLVVLADSAYQTMADLAGQQVSIQAGSSAEEALNAAADFKATLGGVNPYADNAMALLDLDNGSVAATVIDSIVINYYIAQKDAAYRVLDESLAPELYAIGFRKDDIALRDAVNEQLIAMAEDGTLAEISTKWFSKDITVVAEQAAKTAE